MELYHGAEPVFQTLDDSFGTGCCHFAGDWKEEGLGLTRRCALGGFGHFDDEFKCAEGETT